MKKLIITAAVIVALFTGAISATASSMNKEKTEPVIGYYDVTDGQYMLRIPVEEPDGSHGT